MKSIINSNSDFSIVQEEEFSISNRALLELLQETLSKGYSLRLRVRGFSMFPCIRDNDIVTVSPLNGCTSYLGLAVAFIHPHTTKLVIHRVIEQHEDIAIIKGDSVFCIDGLIPLKNILGAVTKLERNNKPMRFGMGIGRTVALFFNKTNVFSVLFYAGMRFSRVIRQAINLSSLHE
ncbi:MAG: S24/S26 family peptidase [Candidatus Omnitrophota bacterium]